MYIYMHIIIKKFHFRNSRNFRKAQNIKFEWKINVVGIQEYKSWNVIIFQLLRKSLVERILFIINSSVKRFYKFRHSAISSTLEIFCSSKTKFYVYSTIIKNFIHIKCENWMIWIAYSIIIYTDFEQSKF